MQSTWGTLMAVRKYAKAGLVSWPQVRFTVLITFIFACLGTWTVTRVSNDVLKMIVPWMLLGIAIYVLLSPGLGKTEARARLSATAFAWLGGGVIGFYDGFFGPGTAKEESLLAAWPLPRWPGWGERVTGPQPAAELAALRHCVPRGSPFAAGIWYDQIVRRRGLESTPRPQGRPKKRGNGSCHEWHCRLSHKDLRQDMGRRGRSVGERL
jgi:hypothetical protein